MKRLLIALLAITLFATACGDDDSGGGNDALVQALADEIESDPDGFTGSRDEAECFSRGMVDGIGVERLAELGVTVDEVNGVDQLDFEPGEGDVVVDTLFDCVDVTELMREQFAADGTPAEEAECMANELDEDTLRSLFSATFAGEEPGGEEFLAKMFEIAATCGFG